MKAGRKGIMDCSSQYYVLQALTSSTYRSTIPTRTFIFESGGRPLESTWPGNGSVDDHGSELGKVKIIKK